MSSPRANVSALLRSALRYAGLSTDGGAGFFIGQRDPLELVDFAESRLLPRSFLLGIASESPSELPDPEPDDCESSEDDAVEEEGRRRWSGLGCGFVCVRKKDRAEPRRVSFGEADGVYGEEEGSELCSFGAGTGAWGRELAGWLARRGAVKLCSSSVRFDPSWLWRFRWVDRAAGTGGAISKVYAPTISCGASRTIVAPSSST